MPSMTVGQSYCFVCVTKIILRIRLMKFAKSLISLALFTACIAALTGCGKSATRVSIPINELKENEFVLNWICLDGFEVGSLAEGKAIFEHDPATIEEIWTSVESGYIEVSGRTHSWNRVRGSGSAVDFNDAIGRDAYKLTYALAVLNSSEARDVVFGIGSNDSVRLWVNGERLYSKWAFRKREIDQDLVRVSLVEGENRIVVKVANSKDVGDLSLRPLKTDTA